ncbi:Phosphate import ATP-binding protein PstB [Mycoplasma suis KI3806]|uniref:Phosphate import ATP-binding protein PstB n=1 Tax=Mycoplasma suis (strain KI_3806) TaxID=708248 RepID=F0V1G2_MYCS3|nr:ATP-binding cassette domain-containing protein [Mycoplasma suis]CBZ40493.1 Phosphate import ATP-binding protein PstB [Mycoplasma suis KI3806]
MGFLNFLKNRREEREDSKKNLFSSTQEEDFLFFQDFTLLSEEGKRSSKKNKVLLRDINLSFEKNKIFAIIGPSGAGKSLLLSSMTKGIFESEVIKKYLWKGKIIYRGTDILSSSFPMELLRKKIGWIRQTPTLLPLTIRENILFALRARGLHNSNLLEKMLQEILIKCGLWEELKDRLDTLPMHTLSVGQAQRLCIARALILEPELLLLDEPTSALDPASTAKIEQLILKLSRRMTIIIVSHSLSQVKHVADYTIFLKNGKIVESGETQTLFTSPKTKDLEDFILSKY